MSKDIGVTWCNLRYAVSQSMNRKAAFLRYSYLVYSEEFTPNSNIPIQYFWVLRPVHTIQFLRPIIFLSSFEGNNWMCESQDLTSFRHFLVYWMK